MFPARDIQKQLIGRLSSDIYGLCVTLLTCLQVAASRVASAVCLPAAVASRAAALARPALTSVQRLGHLAGVSAAVGAALPLA